MLLSRSSLLLSLPFVVLVACDDAASNGTPDAPDTSAPDTTTVEETGTPEETSTPEETATPEEVTPDVVEPKGLPILGNGSHSPASLMMDLLLDDSYSLSSPRDLAFNPDVAAGTSQLFVADADMNMYVVTNPGTPNARVRAKSGLGSDHFMPAPVSLAFSNIGTFATAHETDWITQDSTPADFMGPTLWPTDSGDFDGGWASHLDMLHNSPNAVGIAWDNANAYWVFDGYHQSITFYDFQKDHGPGGEDHSDGIIVRWVEGQVGYVPGVTSDMQLDHATGLLYIADSGNGRIAVLDTKSGSKGATIRPDYDGAQQYAWKDATFRTLVDMKALGGTVPSGLALHDGKVFVTDNATSRVYAFELDNGTPQTAPVDWMDLTSIIPAGNLGALTFDQEGRMVVLDVHGARVVRLAAPAAL